MSNQQHSQGISGFNLHIRTQLIEAINNQITDNGWTQAQAAQRLGVSQPRISHLSSKQIDRFSVDALLNLAARAGLQVTMTVRPGLLHE
jgi:predicted XRE-type DNA-binding protein